MRPPSPSCSTNLPVGLRSGSCGVAASLGRQIVVRDIASDPLCAELANVAVANGVRACCSTPIVTMGERVHGTLALYFGEARGPNTEELDLVTRLTQLAGIAIRRKQDETALRDSEARFRSLFDNVVDGVYQAAPSGELLSANPALVQMLGLDEGAELARLQLGRVLRRAEGARAARQRAQQLRPSAATSSTSCARARAASSSSSRTRGS